MEEKKLRVLFINPPYFRAIGKVYIYLPLGICSLAAVTKNAGYETFVYNMDNPPMASESFDAYRQFCDGQDERDLVLLNLRGDPVGIFEELELVIKSVHPDVVGLSGLTPQMPFAMKVARIAKSLNPNTKTIIGGPHASLRPEEMISDEAIDFAFSGEAEEGILQFLQALETGSTTEQLSKIRGLSFKNGKEKFVSVDMPLVSLDKYPMPARDLFVFPERIQSKNMGLILSGRGCPFCCKFCSSPRLAGFKVRLKPLEQVVDEVEHVIRTYGIDEFMFWEDTFVANKKRTLRFCEILKERGIRIKWRCHTRLDTLNEEILKVMADSGCTQINVGIESGSQKILKYLNKKITLPKVVKKLDLLRNSGMAWTANFMIGYPEETAEDIEDTLNFIRTEVRNHISINTCVPFPGTQFFDDSVALGTIDNTKPFDWTCFAPKSKFASFSKFLTMEELQEYLRRIEEAVEPFLVKNQGAFSPCERA